MRRTIVFLAAIAFSMAGSAYALYSVSDKGKWPGSWPKELESLRKQSRTLVGPMEPQELHEIPFTRREDFEAAWPHLLKVKSKAGPVILIRGPYKFLGAHVNAGVVVHRPPAQTTRPEAPIPEQNNPRTTWMRTTFIELVVDGNVVDLNRIPLPADTPIIDERFQGGTTRGN